MKRFIILHDGDGDTTVIREDGKRYFGITSFIRFLCEAHDEEFVLRQVDMQSAWCEDPAVPDEAYEFARLACKGADLSGYSFNTVFYFAEEVC